MVCVSRTIIYMSNTKKRHDNDFDVESFIGEIKTLKADRESLARRKEEYEDLIYLMSGVSGIDYSKVRGGYNPFGEEERKAKQRAAKSFLEDEIERLQSKIKRTEEILSLVETIEDRDLINEILVEGMNYRTACEIFGISSTSLIKKEIKKIVRSALNMWEENKKKATSW